MNAPTSPMPVESSRLATNDETDIGSLTEQRPPRSVPRTECDLERIRSTLARLSASSVEGLEGLTSELEELQKFLRSEVERVQTEIGSALAGIKIIIDTIAPWKGMTVSVASPASMRALNAGPAASVPRSAAGKA